MNKYKEYGIEVIYNIVREREFDGHKTYDTGHYVKEYCIAIYSPDEKRIHTISSNGNERDGMRYIDAITQPGYIEAKKQYKSYQTKIAKLNDKKESLRALSRNILNEWKEKGVNLS